MSSDSIPWEEFEQRMQGFDPVERRVIEERLRTNFSRESYEFLTGDEPVLLEAVLDRLFPQEAGEKIDLVGFMDWAIPLPLGYGDRKEGLPDDCTMFHEGLRGVDQSAALMFDGKRFIDLEDEEKDQVLRQIQEGTAEGEVWQTIPSRSFFRKLMEKAVSGYFAHPKVWARIGFYGPAYPEGYVWASYHTVQGRHDRKPGYLTF